MAALFLAVICVFFTRAFAFRGTDPEAFIVDIVLVIVLATLFHGCIRG